MDCVAMLDTRCIGKVCMSSAALPFHIRDMGKWHFRKACQEQHLDKHSAFVGKALLARGSCYVENVSELSEDEYPLVHNARTSGLTRCFTIFLHSVERDGADNDEYVLEFFLQLDDTDSRHVRDLVQTLKQIVDFASGFELGEVSPVEVTKLSNSASSDSDSFSESVSKTYSASSDSDSFSESVSKTNSASSDSDSFSESVSKTNSAVVPSQQSSNKNQPDAGKKNDQLKKTRKRKIDAYSSCRGVGHGSDTGVLTVKASFKGDMVKFQFPVSGGLAKLENEVVQRINVKGKRVSLKYEDEDKDMILVTCDADLEFMARNTTAKLIIETDD